MSLKSIQRSISIVLVLVECAKGGLLSYGKDGLGDNIHNHHAHDLHKVSIANSFMHFSGPVEGPVYEVKVPYVDPRHYLLYGEHKHFSNSQNQDGYTINYIAHPKYEYAYSVEDHETGDFHSQKESREGTKVSGEYRMLEPGGSVRVVSYQADKDGFRAVVRTSGKNDHRTTGNHGYNERVHRDKGLLLQPEVENDRPIAKYDDEYSIRKQLHHEQYQTAIPSHVNIGIY